MEDRDIYITIMADETAKKYLETDNYKRLYRYLKQKDSSITFGELTTFLRNADIDIFAAGVVPLEAFKGDRSLTEFNFSKIKAIEASAFEGSGIRQVKLTNQQTVGQAAFKDSAVEEVYLGNGVSVGSGAFARCKNLRELYLPGGVKVEPLAFASCRNLEEVVLDDGRTDWPEDVFANVKHIDYVTVPEQFRMTMFDFDIQIDVLYINGPRDTTNEQMLRRGFPGIKEIEFLK